MPYWSTADVLFVRCSVYTRQFVRGVSHLRPRTMTPWSGGRAIGPASLNCPKPAPEGSANGPGRGGFTDQTRPGQVRSVRFITRPKSRTMRATRQLGLPPMYRRVESSYVRSNRSVWHSTLADTDPDSKESPSGPTGHSPWPYYSCVNSLKR
jgi:hypothetical protein